MCSEICHGKKELAMSDQARDLRAVLGQDSNYKDRFEEAEALAKGIFDPEDKNQYKADPWIIVPGTKVCELTEETANNILFGVETDGGAEQAGQVDARMALVRFEPSSEEAMYLLSGIWLQDIGLVFGLHKAVDRNLTPQHWIRVRNTHHERARDFIFDIWQEKCNWSPKQRELLGTLCLYHRRCRSLDRMSSPVVPGESGPIRLKELAAILRLAGACQFQWHRAPGNILHSDGVSDDLQRLQEKSEFAAVTKPDWKLEKLITDVEVRHDEQCITIYADIPPAHEFGTARVDFRPILEQYRDNLADELRRCQGAFSGYSNLNFREVKLDLKWPDGLGPIQTRKRMLPLWPFMLNTTACASEVSSILAAMLWEQAECVTPQQRDGIRSLLDHAAMLHPYNYLVGRLVRDVWQLVEKGGDYGPQLIQDMKEFLDARKLACEDIPQEARQRLQLMSNEGDSDEKHLLPRQAVIIVYGYSRNVLACVPDFMALFGGHLLVVSCSRMNKFIGGAEYETKRVLEELRGYQRTNRCHCVEVADLHSVLQQLPNDMKPIFLSGARGITPGGEVLNTLGNRVIASATKDHGGRVFVVAEPKKLADFNGRVICKTDGSPAAEDPLKLLDDLREISSPARIDVLRVERVGDVDLLIGPDLTAVWTELPEDQEGSLAAAPSK
jgi:translation initiation factor 2B subunit (eIF-2B alpha/beta/delta family)